VKQNHRLASVAVALDVQRAGAGGDAEEISVDGALRSIGQNGKGVDDRQALLAEQGASGSFL
jgi:hypothetical protein